MNVSGGRIEFQPQTRVDPISLVQMIQSDPAHYKLSGANQLHFKHQCEAAEDKLALIDSLLDDMKLVEKQAA